MEIEYDTLSMLEIEADPIILDECAQLYSSHYGKWSKENPDVNHRDSMIKLSRARIDTWFNNNFSSLYTARNKDKMLIGYAIAFTYIPNRKRSRIAWVSQLVVHKDYRNSDVAKNILYSIWGESSCFAWGIISANPYAIRALEKATRRRCNPTIIKKNLPYIIDICVDNLPYVSNKTQVDVNSKLSLINTEFYVDHSEVPSMVQNVSSKRTPWCLGEIREGWEWLGVTFNSQKQIQLTANEIEEMIKTSNNVTKKAYSRMSLTKEQKWMLHTVEEVDYIVKQFSGNNSLCVYDFGCGIGRHVIELNKRGIKAYGIDYVDSNIQKAKTIAKENGFDGESLFEVEDCRVFKTKNQADIIICLYDVIGSFIKDEDNEGIIKNISNNLKKGGKAIITVMNYEMTADIATQKFVFAKNPNRLLSLKASQTMEKTGDIFNPQYFLLDTDSRIVYRKERFEQGDLPIELIVSDRRFSMDEICSMCRQNGLSVEFSSYINARDWDSPLEATNPLAKEILLICRKDD